MPTNKPDKKSGPKSALDEKFLDLAKQVMAKNGIQSDRAISTELGKHPDFINRVRRGLQSATPDAWDTLFNKYPEAQNISNTNFTNQGSGQAIGTNHGTATNNSYSIADCEKERDSYKAERDTLLKENELLRQQLAMQADLIAAKDETLALLRGGHNRPN